MVFFILALAVVIIVIYGDYVGFWGKSLERPVHDGQVRVACIGDSITYGMRVKNRRQNCYPSVLQKMLGEGYNVRNYGINNRNAMADSPYPYTEEKQFKESLDYAPDIVLLMLGTNDSKKEIWKDATVWRKDYEKLVDSYAELPNKPKIILLTPATLHKITRKDGSEGFSFEMQDTALEEICSTIRDVASDRGLVLIDLHSTTSGCVSAFYKDGVHPNNEGARLIAEQICAVLQENHN